MKKKFIAECVLLVALVTLTVWMTATVEQSRLQPPPVTEPATQPTEAVAPLVATWTALPEDYILTCGKYFVYDLDAERYIMLSGGTGVELYPASITKLFTAYVAMQHLDGDALVTVGEEIEMIDPDSTTAGLEEGDQLTVIMLVGGMMLPSGNDAAYVLAVAAGRQILQQPELDAAQALAAFVEEMNDQAWKQGMTGSHFANPDGIHDDGHYISIEDMCLLGKLAMETPLLEEYARTPAMTVQVGERELTWRNTNALLHDRELKFYNEQEKEETDEENEESEEVYRNFYCEYATGLKTGRTTPAGSCLLSSFDVQDRRLLIGVFDCLDGEYRFSDTLFLLNIALGL